MEKIYSAPIIIIDDEPNILLSFETALRSQGFLEIVTCRDSRQAMDIIRINEPQIILLDLTMPYVSGLAILEQVRKEYPDLPVVIISGTNEIKTAVECIKTGAFDFLLKPINPDRLVATIIKALEVNQLRLENSRLKKSFFQKSLSNPEAFASIQTTDPQLQKIFQYCEAISKGNHPVLIKGETGVGKDLIAHAIHKSSGDKGQLVAVNVAGLEDHMFWDTLFGHIKGAFTGAEKDRAGIVEKAENGTLFLDEIGDLHEPGQVKLLRFLESREYSPLGSDSIKKTNARIIVASLKNLNQLRSEGKFRNDLYYRLRTHEILMPTLRERKKDIPLLFNHFLQEASKEFKVEISQIDDQILPTLEQYEFPGNIRELKALVYNAVSNHQSGRILIDSFWNSMETNKIKSVKVENSSASNHFSEIIHKIKPLPTLKEASDILLEEAMNRSEQNQRQAAKLLGVTPQALNQRLKRLSK